MKKNYFSIIFSDSEVKKIVILRSVVRIEISEKIEKNRKSVRGGRASCGNHPKPVFGSLGGPCDQNEPYTSLVRPFLKKLCGREVGAFLSDFPEIPFWSMCGYVMSPFKNYYFKGNHFFAKLFSGKCLFGSFVWGILGFG